MENKFNVYIPLQKSSDDFLVGIASTDSVDRDSEKMSENALQDMAKKIREVGVNLFEDHEHRWENTLGVIKQAKVEDKKLKIGITLDDPTTNSKVNSLIKKLERGIKLGLSVGGAVTKEKWGYDKEQNKKVKVIDGVDLFEVSVVGIPSNADAFISLPQAIAKSRYKDRKCPICFNLMGRKCPSCLYEDD